MVFTLTLNKQKNCLHQRNRYLQNQKQSSTIYEEQDNIINLCIMVVFFSSWPICIYKTLVANRDFVEHILRNAAWSEKNRALYRKKIVNYSSLVVICMNKIVPGCRSHQIIKASTTSISGNKLYLSETNTTLCC